MLPPKQQHQPYQPLADHFHDRYGEIRRRAGLARQTADAQQVSRLGGGEYVDRIIDGDDPQHLIVCGHHRQRQEVISGQQPRRFFRGGIGSTVVRSVTMKSAIRN